MAGELTLGVELLDEYVAGFPVHVALTVMYRVEGIGRPGVAYMASLTEAPQLDLFAEPDVVGFEMTEADTGIVVLRIAPVEPPVELSSFFPLEPNVPRRVLVDLSTDLRRVQPGTYRLRITYTADWSEVTSEPLLFVLRAPTEDELLSPRVAEGETWREWTLFGSGETGTPERGDPARFERVARTLLRGDDRDPAILDSLDGLYAPEAAVMMLEVLAANGVDVARATEAVRERYPELGWWIDGIAKGQGRIASLRRILR